MVVVVIITTLTALAIPSILKQMSDRRTRQAAEDVAAVYRQARLRALGRGSAVLVRYAAGRYETREAVLGTGAANCVQLPVATCTGVSWNPANLDSQQLSIWKLDGISAEVFANRTKGWSGSLAEPAVTTLDICFTPMGRALARITPADPFLTMSGVPLIRISGSDPLRLKRHVLIPPNGLARTDVAQ